MSNEFAYAKLSASPTIEEIDKEIQRLEKLSNDFNNEQMAIKIFINSVYGACASPFFACYNSQLAEAITLQGQDIIKFSSKVLNLYFQKYWVGDKELHEHLGITRVSAVVNDTAIYGDTDSLIFDARVHTDLHESTIEEMYNRNLKNGSGGITLAGHESVLTTERILNFDKNKIYYAPIKRIIRHKVTKEKWELKTKSGKSIIITSDHSLVVFRNGAQISIKPSDVQKTDKILKVVKN